jgi:hypothetical protein
VTLSLSRVDWYRWLELGHTGEGSSPAMAAWRCGSVVRRLCPAMVRLGEGGYAFMVMKRTNLGNLELRR